MTNRAVAMKDYLPDVRRQVAKLKDVISKSNEAPINMSDLMQMFAFDSMGHFCYDRSFDQIERNQWHDAAVKQRSALSLLGPFTPLPWAIIMAFRFFPGSWKVKDWNDMAGFCEGTMQERITVSPGAIERRMSMKLILV